MKMLKGVRPWRDAFNTLHLELADGTAVSGVRALSPFPLSAPDRCVLFYDDQGAELGMVADLDELDACSRALVRDELALAQLTTPILRITKVTGRRGLTTWGLVTERGPRTVFIKQRSDVCSLPGDRVLFTDVHGMRYEIRDLKALDEKSLRLLELKL